MMVKVWQILVVLLGVWAVAQPRSNTLVEAQVSGLSPNFYDETCPQVFEIVADHVWTFIQNETRIAAKLLRLHFHDCFVQGCDGSVLLAATATAPSEQSAIPNLNSLFGFPQIATIKASLESCCPGVVSCADIIALSAFFSVVFSGGPSWSVPLGRRDSLTAASLSTTTSELIAPNVNITTLKQKIAFQNLSITDLVALSGGHTIGLSRCTVVSLRIYNFPLPNGKLGADPTLNTSRLKTLEANCPLGESSAQGNVTNPMDLQTPTVFDNLYYKNLLEGNGLFQTDEELFTAASDTKALVELYASNQAKFFEDFAQSMIHMGNLNVLTGKNGEVRKTCSVRNPVSDIIEEMVNMGSERKSEGTETLEKSENAVDSFQQIVKKVVEDVVGKELEKMVEETIDWGHSST